jgi:hypothetical protein
MNRETAAVDGGRRIPRAGSPRLRGVMRARRWWRGLVVLLLAAATGCGDRLPGRVNGTVTLDGQPLGTGLVTFHPAGAGALAYGVIDAGGQYVVQTGSKGGLEPGDYVVTVAANASPASPPAPMGNRQYAEPILPLITPLLYAKKERTPLRASVTTGSQTIDFELSSK